MQQLEQIRRKLNSVQVLARFCVRLVILTAFAAFGSIGFGRSLVALLWMSAILSAVMAGLRREPLLGPDLNHWDETVAYGALCALASALSQPA